MYRLWRGEKETKREEWGRERTKGVKCLSDPAPSCSSELLWNVLVYTAQSRILGTEMAHWFP